METLSDESRQISSVVYVGVSNQNSVERARIERRILPISFAQFLQALEHSAVDENSPPISFHQILRSGDRTHTAPK